MPVSPRQEFITPFADEAMRLLRENWSGPNGSKMLSEELFAILQQKIPQPPSGPITINLTLAGQDFIKFKNQFGEDVAAIDFTGNLVNRKKPAPRETPVINWDDPADIFVGTALSATQLNAVAVDRISSYPLDGTYEYDPPSGTMLSVGDNQPLMVVFTPSSTAGYKRARKTVRIDVWASGPLVPSVIWPGSEDDILGGRVLDGDILNAFALDPRTLDDPIPTVVPGVFVYTPAAGAVLTGNTSPMLHVAFTPTDTITYTSSSSDLQISVQSVGEQSRGPSPAVVVGEILLLKVMISNVDLDAEPASTTVSVSDSLGNTYVQVGSYQSVWKMQTVGSPPFTAMKNTISMWYAVVGSPGNATVTVTPSVGAPFEGEPTVIVRGNTASPLDGTASNADDITTDPQTIETTTVGSSAPSGTLDLFEGVWTFIDAQFILSGGAGIFTNVGESAASRNLTVSVTDAVTTPVSSYVAIGASFFQKPSP